MSPDEQQPQNEQSRTQRDYFDAIADEYVHNYHNTPVEIYWDEEFAKYVKAHGFFRPRILEVGAGTGNLIRHFSRGDVSDYVGVDISRRMLEHAKAAHPWARYVAADIFKLPFPDEFFDIVALSGTLHHIRDDDLQAVFSELARLLVPHGHVVGREPIATGRYALGSYSPSLSFSLMSLHHFVYVRTRTLHRPERPVPGYHTSYNPEDFFRHLVNTTLRVDDFRLRFPLSAFFHSAGLGAQRRNERALAAITRAAARADREIEKHRHFGNEIFFRLIKHNLGLEDVQKGFEQFVQEQNIPNQTLLLALTKLAFRIAGIAMWMRK